MTWLLTGVFCSALFALFQIFPFQPDSSAARAVNFLVVAAVVALVFAFVAF